MSQVQLVVSFLWEVTKRVMELLVLFLPVLWKFLRITFMAMLYTVRVMWGSLLPEIDSMAKAIEYNVAEHFPVTFHDHLPIFCKIVASLIVLSTWILLSYVTVWIASAILKYLWS